MENLVAIGTLVLLEGLLSADNALVLAVLVGHLPGADRKRALFYGLFGAFVLRGLALLAAQHIVRLWFLQSFGALYLAYLAVSHFIRRGDESAGGSGSGKTTGRGLWATIIAVELTDLAFAVDSILAAVAISNKLWVIYTGGVIGIVMMRVAAGSFIRLLDRYPALAHMAYVLIGWIALKLGFASYQLFNESVRGATYPAGYHLLPPWLFWTGMALIILGGALYARRHPSPDDPDLQRTARETSNELDDK